MLFFVSVGMLFDPMILITDFGPVIATVLIIVVGKSLAAFAIVRLFRHPNSTALTIAASLAQIGEFSFILVIRVGLQILPERARPDPRGRNPLHPHQPLPVHPPGSMVLKAGDRESTGEGGGRRG